MYKWRMTINLGMELALVNPHALDQSNREPQNRATKSIHVVSVSSKVQRFCSQ